MSFVSYLEKSDREISGAHCTGLVSHILHCTKVASMNISSFRSYMTHTSSKPFSNVLLLSQMSGGCLNIKMSSYQYRDSHVKDKTVSRPSYF